MCAKNVLTERQRQGCKKLAKFRSKNFDVEYASRSERPVRPDDDEIKAFIDVRCRMTTRDG